MEMRNNKFAAKGYPRRWA